MNTNAKTSIGVVVGRFQVSNLTEGHKEILEYVISQNHLINILVLGNPSRDVRSTKNNPLPYRSRKQMIEDAYPGKFEICYIIDTRTNEEWSENLDKRILSITNGNFDVTLYGSRDSFISHYTGKFLCHEYKQRVFHSGTILRKQLAKDIGISEDFRKGCIYATQNNWTNYYPTVDCAIFSDNTFSKLYLAKKEGESLYRFPGGFIDTKDNTYEDAAIREAQEETGLTCIIHKYICSQKIPDWRYCNESEDIMTTFFCMFVKNGTPSPNDDISTLHLLSFKDIKISDIEHVHQKLYCELLHFVKKELKEG